MFQNLYHRFRQGSYLKNEHGIKQYAERCMGQLIRKVTKKSAFYREMDENLLVEKANLRMRQEELHEQAMLDAGDYFSVRRRILVENFVIGAIVVAAIFLNFVAVTAFLNGDTFALNALRWFVAALLAFVLTGGGLIVAERLIETLTDQSGGAIHNIPRVKMTTPIAVLWCILLVGIEVAIMGIAEVRASTLGTAQNSTFLYYGFIVASMMLPLVAGALRWDAMRYLDAYKSTRALRDIESRLAQIDSVLRQNEEYESNFYKIQSISYWDRLNDFKTYKQNYDENKGHPEEPLDNHFAESYNAFQNESYRRYAADLRDARSSSMRRLEVLEDARPGRKVGQRGSPTDLPMPAAAESNDREEREAAASSDDDKAAASSSSSYADLQPIR